MSKLFQGFLSVSCVLSAIGGAALMTSCGGSTAKSSSESQAASSSSTSSSSVASASSESSSKEESSSSSSEVVVTYYTVSFDTNGGSAVASQQVKEGEVATQPDDPTKENYIFEGWYKESTFTNIFEFETTAITADTTIYANWTEAKADSDTNTATFYWNYEGAPDNGVYATKQFEKGAKLRKPSDPTRTGYNFTGWFMEASCETAFVNNTVYTGDQSIYAGWVKNYVFEAEDTQLTGLDYETDLTCNEFGNKIGHGNSNDFSGVGMIGKDKAASGGKAVHGIYYYDAYLDFEINSDVAAKDVTLSLTIAAEFRTVVLTADTFEVLVNDEALAYKNGTITMDGSSYGDGYWDSGDAHAWNTVVINSCDLKAGANLIRLHVNNDNGMSVGTCGAMAPIVDCLQLKSNANLTMTKYENK